MCVTVRAPDALRTVGGSSGGWPRKLPVDLRRPPIADLERHGYRASRRSSPDTIFSSERPSAPEPAGFLKPVIEGRPQRRRGCSSPTRCSRGFGRPWVARGGGSKRHDIVPDIVTIGKTHGQRNPGGRRDLPNRKLLTEFGRNIRYFNTFGGKLSVDRRGASGAGRDLTTRSSSTTGGYGRSLHDVPEIAALARQLPAGSREVRRGGAVRRCRTS